jgi:hypothetical protein
MRAQHASSPPISQEEIGQDKKAAVTQAIVVYILIHETEGCLVS